MGTFAYATKSSYVYYVVYLYANAHCIVYNVWSITERQQNIAKRKKMMSVCCIKRSRHLFQLKKFTIYISYRLDFSYSHHYSCSCSLSMVVCNRLHFYFKTQGRKLDGGIIGMTPAMWWCTPMIPMFIFMIFCIAGPYLLLLFMLLALLLGIPFTKENLLREIKLIYKKEFSTFCCRCCSLFVLS